MSTSRRRHIMRPSLLCQLRHDLGRCERIHGGARGLLDLCRGRGHTRLAQDLLQLLEVERAAAVLVPLGEELVDALLGHVETQIGHGLVEFLARHLAVAVGVPAAEEVNDPRRVLAQRVRELLRDGRRVGTLVDVKVAQRRRLRLRLL